MQIIITSLIAADVVAVIGFMFFAGGMAFINLEYLKRNTTTIQDMDEDFESQYKMHAKQFPSNIYDMGELYNLKNSGFGGIFGWWTPTG
jgi:hypothetical protein